MQKQLPPPPRQRSIFAAVVAAAALLTPGIAAAPGVSGSSEQRCDAVVFDRTDADLKLRTIVVQDGDKQRLLVLTSDTDRSQPCELRWWLDHNPQGVMQCRNDNGMNVHKAISLKDTSTHVRRGLRGEGDGGGDSCGPQQCIPDPSDIQLGYVRTMLASMVYVPQDIHKLSAICIELGCRGRIVRKPFAGSLLQAAPRVRWEPRAKAKRLLVVGLGTSTMALWLRRFLGDAELHVVELSRDVVAAAPCFGLGQKPADKFQLHVADGRRFLEGRQDGDFDAVVIDAFDSNASLPSCFRTREFFSLARKKLAPGGALSLNLINMGETSLQVLKSMELAFGPRSLWVGSAPGAEGVQNIITAFAPDTPLSVSQQHPRSQSRKLRQAETQSAKSAASLAQSWLIDAKYRSLVTVFPAKALEEVESLSDAALCPKSASKF